MIVKNLITVPGHGRFQIGKDGEDLIYANVDPAFFFAKRYIGFAATFDDAKEGENVHDWGQRHPLMSTTFGIELTKEQWVWLVSDRVRGIGSGVSAPEPKPSPGELAVRKTRWWSKSNH